MGHQLQPQQPHFLVVTYPSQGHINPTLNLTKRLAATTGCRVTFCTTVYAHRRMFPCWATTALDPEVEDGLLSYIPFTDGYDDGVKDKSQFNQFTAMIQLKHLGTKNLSAIVRKLADRGRPVTCVIYTLYVSWAADVAREYSISSVPFWIQPATVLLIYYHFFHGYDAIVAAHKDDPMFVIDLPGLPPLRIKDLPSLCLGSSGDVYCGIFAAFRESFMELDREEAGGKKQRVLVNTSDAMEETKAFKELELNPVGPMLPLSFTAEKKSPDSNGDNGHLIKPDEKKYTEWLDSKPERSVVYVSFGSFSVLKKEQMVELAKGLEESGRPYLWVVRKESREGVELVDDGEKGLVVEWCSQVKVLSHSAVGCFVTHCGWNSTIESLGSGMPMVGVPQWSDQTTNAWLAETEWGTGVTAEKNGDGVVEGEELRRCLEVAMGEGEKGVEIRKRAKMWKDRSLEAIGDGGSSDRNLKALVEEMSSYV